MGDDARLTPGQRLMLGLVISPGALLMALGTLFGPLSTPVVEWDVVEVVVNWVYVLFLAWVGGWTLTMALTGRAPEGPR